jgi:hypothetical protein
VFVFVTWLVGVVIPAVATYGSERSEATQLRAQTLVAAFDATYPTVAKVEASFGKDSPATFEAQITSPYLEAEFHAEAAIFATVPSVQQGWSESVARLDSYVAFAESLAECGRYNEVTSLRRDGLIAEAQGSFIDAKSYLIVGGPGDPDPRWTAVYCRRPSTADEVIQDLAPPRDDFNARVVRRILQAPVRGHVASTRELLRRMFLPWL